MWLGYQSELQTRKHNKFLAWTSYLISSQAAVLVLLAQEQEQGRWSRVYPAAARPVNESKVDQIMGIGVTRLWEAHKDAEKKPPIFCDLIIVVMTLLKSGRLETG